MGLVLKKKPNVAESNITYVGVTNYYGAPQFVLVDSDKGKNPHMKFAGLKFRAPINGKTLEDSAVERFEEQTGLKIREPLGLRFISPTMSVGSSQRNFRNVFFGLVDNASMDDFRTDGRNVYVLDVGNGRSSPREAYLLGNSGERKSIEWLTPDNEFIRRNAEEFLNRFNYTTLDGDWFKKIPCPAAPAIKSDYKTPLGCAMAVSSMILVWHKPPYGERHIVTLKLNEDPYGEDHPGYAGGKIERLLSRQSKNVDPVSACIEEGIEEYGFSVVPRALVCVSATGLDVPRRDAENHFNSIINYTFIVEPKNSEELAHAIKNPDKYLTGKHGSYFVEPEEAHRDRIRKKEMRMPNMVNAGECYFDGSPGSRIPLTQIVSSGIF